MKVNSKGPQNTFKEGAPANRPKDQIDVTELRKIKKILAEKNQL